MLMFCAEALFVIFTSKTERARRRNANARDDRKIFNPSGVENLEQAPLHPKIFEKFSSQSGSCALAE